MTGTAPSTLLFNPARAADIPDCTTETGGGFTTGDLSSLTAQYVTFEDLALVGGPRFCSCLLKVTTARSGDAVHFTASRTHFSGREVASTTGLFLADASFILVESCLFSALKFAIDGAAEINGLYESYVNNLVISNSTFYSESSYFGNPSGDTWNHVDPKPMINLPSRGAVTALHMTGNAFERGPNAIHIYRLQGGDLTGNWFRGEVADNPHDGTWIVIDQGTGFAMIGNYIDQGYQGISMQAYGALIDGNYFQGMSGGAIRLLAGSAVVAANTFKDAPGPDQVDIDVFTGDAHRIGPNNHATNGVQYYVRLHPGAAGELFGSRSLFAKVNDTSGGAWSTVVTDNGTRVPSVAKVHDPQVLRGGDGACYRLGVSDAGIIGQPLPRVPCPDDR
jgi:hypothetical protein